MSRSPRRAATRIRDLDRPRQVKSIKSMDPRHFRFAGGDDGMFVWRKAPRLAKLAAGLGNGQAEDECIGLHAATGKQVSGGQGWITQREPELREQPDVQTVLRRYVAR